MCRILFPVITAFLLGAAFLPNSDLHAYQPVTRIEFSRLWRWDTYVNNITQQNPKGTPTAIDNLNLKNLDFALIGGKGTLAMPPQISFWLGDDFWWLNQFYVRGYTYWGRQISSGNYKEFTDFVPSFISSSFTGTARHLRTRDYEIAFGWLMPFFSDCWNGFYMGPIGGYSYDRFEATLQDVMQTIAINGNIISTNSQPNGNGITISSKWRGPWAGFDLYYQWHTLTVSAGYEYHWMSWHGAFTVPGGKNSSFSSDTRNARHGIGSVGRLECSLLLYDHWLIEIGGKYRRFRARGSVVPVGGFAAANLPADTFLSVDVLWVSWEFLLSVGYQF